MDAKEVCAVCGEWLDKRERVACDLCGIPLHGGCAETREGATFLCECCNRFLAPANA